VSDRIRALLISTACAFLLAGSSAPAPVESQPLRTEFLMTLSARLGESQPIGETPLGGRRIVYVESGEFHGPGLDGIVLPGGGDWVLVDRDGITRLDVRITLRTDDGALIYVVYRGVSDLTAEARDRILAGEAVDPSTYYFRTTPYFETSSEKYRWLNRLVTVGVGRRTRTGVEYTIHAVR
jgi:hypothetical protein